MRSKITTRQTGNCRASKSQRHVVMVCIALVGRLFTTTRQQPDDVAHPGASRTVLDCVAPATPEETCLPSSLSAWSLPIGDGMQFSNIAIEAAYRGECDFALWLMAERLPRWDIGARLSLYEAGPHRVANYLKLYNRPNTIDYDLHERLLFSWAVSEAVRDSWIQFNDGPVR